MIAIEYQSSGPNASKNMCASLRAFLPICLLACLPACSVSALPVCSCVFGSCVFGLVSWREVALHISRHLQQRVQASFTSVKNFAQDSTRHGERMACAQFQVQAVQLISALEARGRQFSQSSKAGISIAEFEHPLTRDAFIRLTNLQYQLHLDGDEPLSLADARILYLSPVLDTLCSVLARLPWRHFCIELGTLTAADRSFMMAGSALNRIYALLHAHRRVQPPSDAVLEEVFGRYHLCKREVLAV